MRYNHALVPLASLLFCLLASFEEAEATGVVVAQCKSHYFKAQRFILFANEAPESILPKYLRTCLQLHRAIAASPQLAKRLKNERPNLGEEFAEFAKRLRSERSDSGEEFTQWENQWQRVGLSLSQVENQPGYVYTIHILSYRDKKTLQWFVNRWLHRRMNRYRIYAAVPKSFQLFIRRGDVVTKDDPLYAKINVGKRHNLNRLCYGVYENKGDAYRDRKILEHQLGLRVRIIQERLTTGLIDRIWFKSVTGGWPHDWEIER